MFSARIILAAALAAPLSLWGLACASPSRRSVAYYDPAANDGSMLSNVGNGLGEPFNVIVSGLSSADVLTDDGIVTYAHAIGFSTECLGIHIGKPQSANLGDGNGWVNQMVELRQDYWIVNGGTCLESLRGGFHFRVFRQNGALADSGALFLAVSKEEPAIDHHNIVPDGYDIGRDGLVAAATGYRKSSVYNGVNYFTTAREITGLLTAGSTGVNHGISQDGIVMLLTVTTVS